jgi:MATE family multidrug resistance protein
LSLSNFLSESRKTLHLAIPIIVGNVGQTMITFTDTLMVGRLGAEELAAAGFAGNLFMVFLLFGIGALAPAAAVMAHSHGRHQPKEISEVLRHTVLLTLLMSAGLMVLLVLGSPLMAHMGQTTEVVKLSHNFFLILVASLLPSLVFQAYKQFTDGLGHPKIGMYVTMAAIAINATANYILIHGLGPVPALGLNGSAVATLLTRLLMAAAIITFAYRIPALQIYRERLWQKTILWNRMGSLFRLGLPNGLTYVFEVGAFTFSSVMMGWLGAAPLAAHQIALNLASISFLVTVGIGVAASIRVGFELGQGRLLGARKAGRNSIS